MANSQAVQEQAVLVGGENKQEEESRLKRTEERKERTREKKRDTGANQPGSHQADMEEAGKIGHKE